MKSARTVVVALLLLAAIPLATADAQVDCRRTVQANVVALDQVIWLNRLGANIPGGTIYALAGDVVSTTDGSSCAFDVTDPNAKTSCTAGEVMLAEGKRPRPLVLRANQGDCLQITFTNLLSPSTDLQRCSEPPLDVCSSDSDCADGTCTATNQPTTRTAGIHLQGLSWVDGPQDDSSYVGGNPNSLAAPGDKQVYTLVADHEGPNLLYSAADDFFTPAAGGDGGTLPTGLFGSINVQPSGYYTSRLYPGSPDWSPEWYRSQVTEQDLCWASSDGGPDPGDSTQCVRANPGILPKINYQAVYPAGHPRAGLPILNMLCSKTVLDQPGASCTQDELVHSDLTAVITGPDAGRFPLAAIENLPPSLRPEYSYPTRQEPYREFTIIYHETFVSTQAFPYYYGALHSLPSVGDNFGINYGIGGLGSPIIANRLGVGPLGECTDCKYEEFFLSSWTGGDPAMNVDVPTSTCVDSTTGQLQSCSPASMALYPDDPSNVYHAYMSDHLKFRILHAGPDLHHLHHQHAHQWLGSPDTPHGDYLDSQSIGPGSAFTLEMVYGGSGNVNQTVGDSIFHCHFYPHFASGMWSLWRVHDVFEAGTELEDGKPAAGARALPDAEIAAGTPIPALVPLPTIPMAPMPAPVHLVSACLDDKTVACTTDADCSGQNLGRCVPVTFEVCSTGPTPTCISALDATGDPAAITNPGYPFFIPGLAGSRAPHPPLDFAWSCSGSGDVCDPADPNACDGGSGGSCDDKLDGGLPRNIFAAGTADYIDPADSSLATWANVDYSKKILTAKALELPEQGTTIEQVAMKTHSERFHQSCLPNRRDPSTCTGSQFILNGLPPVQGAPYADPCIEFSREGGKPVGSLTSRYLGVDIQLDAIFNKEGWHFPQQRIISLWGDAYDTLQGTKPPEPLFMRINSYDCADYVLANLVPNVYELDDFQVRTPTDVLGQHIHLVKFDVTSSDGSANGWNYEDGTFGPNEVVERIDAIRAENQCPEGENDPEGATDLKCPEAKPIRFFGPGPGNAWVGAQATVQRWYNDPLLNNNGVCSDDLAAPCRLHSDVSKCADPKTAQCWVSAGICTSDTTVRCDASASQCPPGPGGVKPACIPAGDRTIRTVFTHDHFSPSTHQQAGLYAGLVAEPKGSQWLDNQTGAVMGGFDPSTGGNIRNPPDPSPFAGGSGVVRDGGPTSWQAVIRLPDTDPAHPYPQLYKDLSFREFLLQVQDSALFYQPFSVARDPFQPQDEGFCSANGVCVDPATGDPPTGTPVRCEVPVPGVATTPAACTGGTICRLHLDNLVACTPGDDPSELASVCNDGLSGTPGPQSCNLIPGVPYTSWSSGGFYETSYKNVETITFNNSTNNFSFNYRNEPLFPRVLDPATGAALPGASGDLAYVFVSRGFCSTSPNGPCESDSDCTGGGTCEPRVSPRGSVCTTNLSTPCTADSDCPSSGSCQPAGFCSDNWQLCTSGQTGLCGGAAASCLSDPTAIPYPALTAGIEPGDPFTPLLRSYAGDDIQVRALMGAHINPHNFTIHGIDWLIEPSFVDSGWRNSQVMGISEHFELVMKVPAAFDTPAGGDGPTKPWADYVFQPGAAAIEQASGNWGLIRSYEKTQDDLVALPQNPEPASGGALCANPDRQFQVVALTAAQALVNTSNAIVYNTVQGPIDDPEGILYFDLTDPQLSGCPTPADGADWSTCTWTGTEPQPLVLRAAAGECIRVTLYNGITDGYGSGNGISPLPNGYPTGCIFKPSGGAGTTQVACGGSGNPPCCNQTPVGCDPNAKPKSTCTGTVASNTSAQVGMRPQLVTYDPQHSDGTNAGFNPVQTASPGGSVVYDWYAGHIDPADGRRVPIEFGASNLLAPDQLNQYAHGLFAGLIIEPASAKPTRLCADCGWTVEDPTRAVVTYLDPVTRAKSSFREFVTFMQDGPLPLESNIDAVNYKSEPTNLGGILRFCEQPVAGQPCDGDDLSCTFSLDAYCNDTTTSACSTVPARQRTPAQGQCIDGSGNCTACAAGETPPGFPVTPTFLACAGEPVRFRLLHPGGTNTNNVFELYGHGFSEGPYMTPAPDCQGMLMHSPLAASPFLGTFNLCGSKDWKVGPVTTDGLFGESLNEWKGAYMGHGPTNHFNVLIDRAGGPGGVSGDYLYRSFPADHFNLGIWGIFEVVPRDQSRGLSCLPEGSPDATSHHHDATAELPAAADPAPVGR